MQALSCLQGRIGQPTLPPLQGASSTEIEAVVARQWTISRGLQAHLSPWNVLCSLNLRLGAGHSAAYLLQLLPQLPVAREGLQGVCWQDMLDCRALAGARCSSWPCIDKITHDHAALTSAVWHWSHALKQ